MYQYWRQSAHLSPPDRDPPSPGTVRDKFVHCIFDQIDNLNVIQHLNGQFYYTSPVHRITVYSVPKHVLTNEIICVRIYANFAQTKIYVKYNLNVPQNFEMLSCTPMHVKVHGQALLNKKSKEENKQHPEPTAFQS